nr:uncharacterized protein LOC113819866 [Penaeus vannamei]
MTHARRLSVISDAVMAGRGNTGWRCLVLLCSFQAALAAGIPQKQRSQCPIFPPGQDIGGKVPLYVGIFPEEEDWEWEMEFKNETKTFFRLNLQSNGERITARLISGLYGEIQPPPVEWSEAAFPVREWSHLAVYADGDHLVVAQRQNSSSASVKFTLSDTDKWFRIVSNGNMTHNCLKGHSISSVSEVLQVTEDNTYCLQAAGPPVTVSGDGASYTVTNATWQRIEEQAGSYSVDGVIFVIENCDSRLNTTSPTTLTTEGNPTTIEGTATTTTTEETTSPSDLTTHFTGPAQSASPTTTDSTSRVIANCETIIMVVTSLLIILTILILYKIGFHREVLKAWREKRAGEDNAERESSVAE